MSFENKTGSGRPLDYETHCEPVLDEKKFCGMMARSNVNEIGTFLLNGNNCMIVAIFCDKKDEKVDQQLNLMGQHVRQLKYCPSAVAVCSPEKEKWMSVARQLSACTTAEQHKKELLRLIKQGDVIIVKSVGSVDVEEKKKKRKAKGKKGKKRVEIEVEEEEEEEEEVDLEEDEVEIFGEEEEEEEPRRRGKRRQQAQDDVGSSSTKLGSAKVIPLTPACVGTVYKLQGATVRGRVVIDLQKIGSTQSVYTALTRSTMAERLTLTPRTDVSQWLQLRFPPQVYEEHFWLTSQVETSIGRLDDGAKLFFGQQVLDGMCGRIVERNRVLLSTMSGKVIAERGESKLVEVEKVERLKIFYCLKGQEKEVIWEAICDRLPFSFQKVLVEQNITLEDFENIEEPLDLVKLQVIKGLFVKWCKDKVRKEDWQEAVRKVCENDWKKIEKNKTFKVYCEDNQYKIKRK